MHDNHPTVKIKCAIHSMRMINEYSLQLRSARFTITCFSMGKNLCSFKPTEISDYFGTTSQFEDRIFEQIIPIVETSASN